MNLNHICLNCMKEKPQFGVSCPYCGFDESQNPKDKSHLNYFTILRGQFLVGKTLGQGGFGITYVGFDMNLEMKIAIKEYYPNGFAYRNHDTSNHMQLSNSEIKDYLEKEQKNFIEEARILAQLDDLPGIVKVRDYFQENNTSYIVMEYVEGETLQHFIKKNAGRMATKDIFNMMEPVVKSMIQIHDQNVVHRDISPDNIMILPNKKIKLIDFGAADRGKNLGLGLVYKEYYSPIEQRTEQGIIGPYSDIYSLCATIYMAITGCLPNSVLEREQHDCLKKPSQLGIQITEIQENALMKGLSVEAKNRFQNARDLYYFLYLFGEKEKPNSALSRSIEEQKTQELIDKFKSRTKVNKYRVWLERCMIILVLLCGMYFILHGAIVKHTNQSGERVDSYLESVNTDVSLEKLEKEFFNASVERQKKDYQKELKTDYALKEATDEFAEILSSAQIEDRQDSWNEFFLSTITALQQNYDLTDVKWMIIPVRQLQEANAVLDLGISNETNHLNFSKAETMAVSVAEHDKGYYFYIVFMK